MSTSAIGTTCDRDNFWPILRDQKPDITGDEIAAAYARHLDTVEAIQTQQRAYLRHLVDEHGVRAVYLEGLTAGDLRTFRTMAALCQLRHDVNRDLAEIATEETERHRSLAGLAANRQDWLSVGAAGQLLAKGVVDVRPLDDAEAHARANPLAGGKVMPEVAASTERHDAMVKILAADKSPLLVLVLGGAHDLSGSVRRLMPRAGYVRVTMKVVCFTEISWGKG